MHPAAKTKKQAVRYRWKKTSYGALIWRKAPCMAVRRAAVAMQQRRGAVAADGTERTCEAAHHDGHRSTRQRDQRIAVNRIVRYEPRSLLTTRPRFGFRSTRAVPNVPVRRLAR